MKIKNVIILGCGRSGTSIFGEFFEHLSAFEYWSEPPFVDIIGHHFQKPLAIKVPKESPGYPPDPGLSFSLKQLQNTIPDPIIFYWQVRHPLDTICSLKVGISKNWGHHPQPPDWKDWLDQPLVKQCPHHWNYINTIGFEKVQHLVTVTHFENMISDPRSFALQRSEEVGTDTTQEWNNIIEWSNRVQDTNNAQFVEAKTSRPYSTTDHQVRVGRWKENLSKEEVKLVWPLVAKTAQHFGYNL